MAARKPYSSTGTMTLHAMNEEPEIRDLLQVIGKKYPQSDAQRLVRSVIERTSTSTLTLEYGSD